MLLDIRAFLPRSVALPFCLALVLMPTLAFGIATERSLASFMGDRPELRLNGAAAHSEISVPLPARWQPRNVQLTLVYRNSVSLLPEHSQLRVELNGLVIAQFPLNPQRPEGRATIRLPLDLLHPGYNALRFAVAQHTIIDQCEDPTAPELWTQIDTEQSVLQLEYERLPIADQLSRLNEIFDRHHWGEGRVGIATDQTETGADTLKWGALVAQAAALHLEFVPLLVNAVPLSPIIAADEPTDGRRFPWFDAAALGAEDLILVGTRDQLATVLGRTWANGVTDGYLAIFPRDDDPTLAMLVVSGRDEAEVTRAAIALGLIDLPFPDVNETRISDLSILAAPAGSGPRNLPAGIRARFTDLDVDTTTLVSPLQPARSLSVLNPVGSSSVVASSLGIDFWVLAGLYTGGELNGGLRLNFTYGAGLRGDSVLNILLNGKFVKGISLDEPNGASFNGYEVGFPVNLLRAGPNRIELIPMMVPSETDFCTLRQGENLLLTLYGDSTLQLPPASQFVQLPDLSLLVRAGFPFLMDPQGGDLALQVMGRDPASIAAAWTLMARLAQVTALPLHQAQVGFEAPTEARDLIAVGALTDLDPGLAQAAPLSFDGRATRTHYSMPPGIVESESAEHWYERGLSTLENWFGRTPLGVAERLTAQAVFDGHPLGQQGVLMAFQSPSHPGRSVLMLIAGEPALLQQRTAQLVQPDRWYNLRGALALWDERPDSLRWQTPRSVYTVGDGPIDARLSYYFTRTPMALLATALVLFISLAVLVLWMLRRFKRRTHPEIQDGD